MMSQRNEKLNLLGKWYAFGSWVKKKSSNTKYYGFTWPMKVKKKAFKLSESIDFWEVFLETN